MSIWSKRELLYPEDAGVISYPMQWWPKLEYEKRRYGTEKNDMVYLKDDPESSEAVLYFLRLTSRYAMLASYSRTMFSSNTSIQNSQARVSRNKVEQLNQLRSTIEVAN